jgi:hypothetical protein
LKEEKRPSLNNTCGPERLYSIVQLEDLQAPTASVESLKTFRPSHPKSVSSKED